MHSSGDAARDAVVGAILALERACLNAETALGERRWDDAADAVREQASRTGELAALFAASPRFAPANDAAVARRLRGILAFRDEQLDRLRAQRDDIAARLASIAKLRALARSVGTRLAPAAYVDAQR